DEMDTVLAEGLGVPSLRVITPPLDAYAAAREQWDDGCNVLALAPGTVVAYERAAATNDHLRSEGVEVLEFDGDELGRGGGGPRCWTCRVARGGSARSRGARCEAGSARGGRGRVGIGLDQL